jgi:hypothetical protein
MPEAIVAAGSLYWATLGGVFQTGHVLGCKLHGLLLLLCPYGKQPLADEVGKE